MFIILVNIFPPGFSITRYSGTQLVSLVCDGSLLPKDTSSVMTMSIYTYQKGRRMGQRNMLAFLNWKGK